jgi:hypothetical protein
MKLLELEPKFLRYEPRDGRQYFVMVESIAEAQGVQFLCPKCWTANGGPVGTHAVICWNPSVPPTLDPKPGRWNLVGTGLHDLSLVAGSSSIKLLAGCEWHGFVTKGEVTL